MEKLVIEETVMGEVSIDKAPSYGIYVYVSSNNVIFTLKLFHIESVNKSFFYFSPLQVGYRDCYISNSREETLRTAIEDQKEIIVFECDEEEDFLEWTLKHIRRNK